MALFSGRASMLEVQNRALIKTAGERAERISELERELQRALQELERLKAERKLMRTSEELRAEAERLRAEAGRLKAERDRLKTESERLKAEVERLKVEHEAYRDKITALEQHNHELTEAATNYSVWGQKLERELAEIDPDGVPARRFGAGHDA
jgi:chromosome segregation ATPase